MQFTINFKTIQISLPKFKNNINQVFSKEIERAAIAWLNATVLAVVPIWSGASRATFQKLAREVNFPLTITGIKPSAQGFINAGVAGPRLGFQQSTGKLEKDTSRLRYTFTYGTSLFHLVFNEFNDANANPEAGRLFARLIQPGPYNFQELGRNAFLDVARTVDLPSPWNNLTLESINIRFNG